MYDEWHVDWENAYVIRNTMSCIWGGVDSTTKSKKLEAEEIFILVHLLFAYCDEGSLLLNTGNAFETEKLLLATKAIKLI